MLEMLSSSRRKDCWPNKQNKSEMSFSELSTNRRKSESKRMLSIPKSMTFFSHTRSNSELKFSKMKKSRNKKDLTIWKREESSDRSLTQRRINLSTLRRESWKSLRVWVLIPSTRQSCPRKRLHNQFIRVSLIV
jgi:hypothetical protein